VRSGRSGAGFALAVGLSTALAPTRARAQGAPFPANPGSSGSSLDLQLAGLSPPPPKHGEHLHDGFYFRYAVGPAFVQMAGTGPPGTVGVGSLGLGEVLALGGTPAAGLVVAGAIVGDVGIPTVNGNVTVVGVSLYGAAIDWFPAPRGGWHVGGVVGLGATGYGSAASALSIGASVFAGYDLWIDDQWSFGALLVATSSPRTSTDDARPSDPTSLMPIALALEATVLCH
jgi:hypothetical protein